MEGTEISRYTGRGETILAIESDELMRELISEVLTMYGYKVHVVGNIRDAIHSYSAQPEQFQLILADLWLAGLSDMLAEVLRTHPNMSVVLTSDHPLQNRYYRHLGLSILEKPFDITELFFALRMALENENSFWSKRHLN